MVFQFHRDAYAQFEQQQAVASDHIFPFIEKFTTLNRDAHVLEIGCGEGGVLKASLERGYRGTGVELSEPRYEHAQSFLQQELGEGKIKLVRQDIHQVQADDPALGGPFDLIILKDVIEHIHHKPQLLHRLKDFLKPDGIIFFGFPPWQMPFGGHQQICSSKVLSVWPWCHLLPRFLYRGLLRLFREPEAKIADLLEIKETGISLEQFGRLVQGTGFRILRRRLYLINPIYRYKFGLKPRKQFRLIAGLPYLRHFVTTCGYYLVGPTRP